MDLLTDLTPAQREAVTHIDGPLLVLAGAGSGKTRVITRRVAYLVAQGIRPWEILAITFTNKAAEEMRTRIAALVDPRGLTVATFHSFCARVLRTHAELAGLDAKFVIYATAEQKRAMKQAIEGSGLDTTNWTPDKMAARISHMKNRLESAEEFAKTAGDWSGQSIAKIYTAYERILRRNHALDFDDLLMLAARALRDTPEFRDELQDRYKYILIDEYQDTNEAQYLIASKIAERSRNICATGDPDQSIYGWRGADIHNILDFEKDFTGCKVVRLERNYRSTPEILAAASALIRHNTKRKEKGLHTENPPGPPVRVAETASSEEEARLIAEEIRREFPTGEGLGGVAVFYRVNALSRALEDALRAQGLAYEIVRGMSFYERQEIRALVAYLRVIVNPSDNLAVERAINIPPRAIGETTVAKLSEFAGSRGTSLLEACRLAGEVADLASRAKAAIARFVALIDDLAQGDISLMQPLVTRLIDLTDFNDWCRKLDDGDDDRTLNVGEFVNIAAAFDAEMADQEPGPEVQAIGAAYPLMLFLERVSLTSDQDDLHQDVERVHLMTLHAAKGLEFPVVYMVGLEQGLLPHVMAEEEGRDVEEERRLCFVGMTRARRRLTMTMARYRMQYGQTNRQSPSVFLREIGSDGVRRDMLPESQWDSSAGGAPGYGSSRGKSFGAGRSSGGYGSRRRTPAYRAPAALSDGPTYEPVDDEDTLIRSAASAESSCPYHAGQRVRHATYGLGKITSVSGSGPDTKVTIHFSHIGVKTFAAGVAKLRILENGQG